MMQTAADPTTPDNPCIKVAPILNSCNYTTIELDGSVDAEDIQDEISKFMAKIGEEEWRVVDCEGFGFSVQSTRTSGSLCWRLKPSKKTKWRA